MRCNGLMDRKYKIPFVQCIMDLFTFIIISTLFLFFIPHDFILNTASFIYPVSSKESRQSSKGADTRLNLTTTITSICDCMLKMIVCRNDLLSLKSIYGMSSPTNRDTGYVVLKKRVRWCSLGVHLCIGLSTHAS